MGHGNDFHPDLNSYLNLEYVGKRCTMLLDIVFLILSLEIILLSCELFTNGIEWLGEKLKVGDGVVGSIFSAVGTCLPETIIPIVAILFSDGMEDSIDIGIGAIVGAPFMLSTLAFFLTGASVLVLRKKRKTGMKMKVNNRIVSRDISFFIILYTLGVTASFIDNVTVRYIIAFLLAACYIHYIILTIRSDYESHGRLESLYITSILKVKPGLTIILLQVITAFAGIVFGARLFVQNIERGSQVFGIPTLVLSLIITPIATELPEKFNSIIWIRKKKDTLALGNITGAMVFQSCLPVSIGILATPWQLDIKVILSSVLAVLSASVTYFWIKINGRLSPVPLLTGGLFYAVFITFLFLRNFK